MYVELLDNNSYWRYVHTGERLLSQTVMNFRSDLFCSSSRSSLRFPSLHSSLALSATQQKVSTVVKKSDIETETLTMCKVPIPSLLLSLSHTLSLSLPPAWHPSIAVSVPCQQYGQAEICIHPALCSAPSLAVRRCPRNLLPTPNWITSLVFCADLAPAVFHLLS